MKRILYLTSKELPLKITGFNIKLYQYKYFESEFKCIGNLI